MYSKNVSLMKINNIILVLHTRIISLYSFMIYFVCICHSGRFPIIFYKPTIQTNATLQVSLDINNFYDKDITKKFTTHRKACENLI